MQREMYIYMTTLFICEVWYMYVFKYEWRENQNTLSQWVNIQLLLYLSTTYIHYTYSCDFTHTDGYLTHTIIMNKYINNCKIKCNHDLKIYRVSKVENNNCVSKFSNIIQKGLLLSIAMAVCMCSSMILVYCYEISLEVYMLLLYYNIQVICMHMYNTCIPVLSHYTAKGKHKWGENPHFHKHPWVYSKYTDHG